MSVDFETGILKPGRAAEKYVAETGGLPEIEKASTNLRAAIRQTGQEIDDANFASRYSRNPTVYYETVSAEKSLSSKARLAIEAEGECGLKRLQLNARLARIESGLNGLIDELVELRADLNTSQQEM